MKYRFTVEFDKNGEWEKVVAPVFRTDASEEEIYARTRQFIETLETGSSPAPGLDDARDAATASRRLAARDEEQLAQAVTDRNQAAR